MAVTHERRLLSWLTAVRRSRSAALAKMATLVTTLALPTERVLWAARRYDNNEQRGQHCKLCGHPEDTNVHALCYCTDRYVTAARTLVVRDADQAFRAADGRRPLDAVVHRDSAGQPLSVPAWFDPLRQTKLVVCPLVPKWAVRSLRTFCPLAGLIGILPPGLQDVLAYARTPGGWRRCSHKEVAEREGRIRETLLFGGLRVWQTRYSRFVNWWWSADAHAKAARIARSEARVAGAICRAKRTERVEPAHGMSLRPDPAAHTRAAPSTPKRPKRCSTCAATGHDVRTCPTLKPAPVPATPSKVTWPHIKCDSCNMHPIVGARFKCTACKAQSFDLCAACSAAGARCHRNPAHTLAPVEKRVNKCSVCEATGHNAKTCPDRPPTPSPDAHGRHSPHGTRPPEATARVFAPFMVVGQAEATKWGAEAEVRAADSRWLRSPPGPY